jgi:PhnB protein
MTMMRTPPIAALSMLVLSLEEPGETPYGDRRAMVRDPFGNIFQIAHQLT